MTISIGSASLKEIFVGGTSIRSVYVGSSLVWSKDRDKNFVTITVTPANNTIQNNYMPLSISFNIKREDTWWEGIDIFFDERIANEYDQDQWFSKGYLGDGVYKYIYIYSPVTASDEIKLYYTFPSTMTDMCIVDKFGVDIQGRQFNINSDFNFIIKQKG